MTKKEERALARALASWEPRAEVILGEGLSIRRVAMRESLGFHVAKTLGLEEEQFLVQMDAARMTA